MHSTMGLLLLAFGVAAVASVPLPGDARPNLPLMQNLYGFWPLTLKHDLADFSGNKITPSGSDIAQVNPQPGPFGQPNTSFALIIPNNLDATKLTFISFGDLPSVRGFSTNNSFSVSFAFNYNSTSGIFANLVFIPTSNYGGLWINYEFPDVLSVVTFTSDSGFQTLAKFQSIFKPMSWSFVTITYDGQKFSIYNRNGDLIDAPVPAPQIASSLASANKVVMGSWVCGQYNPFGFCDYIYIQGFPANYTSMACLGIYNASLTGAQAKQFFDGCQQFTDGANTEIAPMPRQDILFGFWPLDSAFGYNSPVQGRARLQMYGGFATIADMPGPYGYPKTSMTAVNDVMGAGSASQQVSTRYTTNFAIYASQSGSIVSYFNRDPKLYSTSVYFSFIQPNMLRIESLYNKDSNGSVIVGDFPVVKTNDWTLLSVTIQFDDVGKFVNIFNAAGNHLVISHPIPSDLVYIANVCQASIGGGMPFSAKNAISCLSVYNDILSPAEITQAFATCQRAHQFYDGQN